MVELPSGIGAIGATFDGGIDGSAIGANGTVGIISLVASLRTLVSCGANGTLADAGIIGATGVESAGTTAVRMNEKTKAKILNK